MQVTCVNFNLLFRRPGAVWLFLLLSLCVSLAAPSSVFANGLFQNAGLPIVVNHGGGPIEQDQLIDLGTIAPGTVKRLVFSVQNQLNTTVPLIDDPVVFDGDELNAPTAMPAELQPGEKKFFAIDSTGLGAGEIVRPVSVVVDGPNGQTSFNFRVRVNVLTPAHAQLETESIYNRYRQFAAADNKQVSVQLGQFQTHYVPALNSLRYLDLFDYVQVQELADSTLVSGEDQNDSIALTPVWHTVNSEVVAADSARVGVMDTWTVADLLNQAENEAFPISELVAATAYEVQLDYDGQTMTYKAAVFWTQKGNRAAYVHDRVIRGLGRLMGETRNPVSRAVIENQTERPALVPSSTAAKNGPVQCLPQVTDGATTHSYFGFEGHESGRHISGNEFQWTCRHMEDCTNRCEARADTSCYDNGRIHNSLPFITVISHVVVEQQAVQENREKFNEPVTCGVRQGCAVAKCYGFFCADNFDFSLTQLGGGGVSFGVTGGDDIPLTDLSWMDERTCPPPTRCGEGQPGGPCDGGNNGSGPYRASFQAVLTESGAAGNYSGSADVTLTSGQTTETLTISSSGNYDFAALLQNGAAYSVSVAGDHPDDVCRVDNSDGTVNGGNVTDITVRCTRFHIPSSCPFNPTDCITPPDGCETVPVLRGFLEVSTLTTLSTSFGVDNGNLTYGENVDFSSNFFGLFSNRTTCGGNLRFGGGSLAKSSVTDGPVLYSRNDATPVSGQAVIWGVARDDAHGVSDVEIYIDGQAANLGYFAFNLRNGLTCSEWNEGMPCDDTSSYYGVIDTLNLSPGTHEVIINATNSAGVSSVIRHDLVVAAPSSPNVVLLANYVSSSTGQRVSRGSLSSGPSSLMAFRYDQSQGNFKQRPGGSCAPTLDNPTKFQLRLGGDPSFQIDGCQIRASWDNQWFTCSPGLVQVVNQRAYLPLNTDSHFYGSCDFNNPTAPHLGTGEPAWFKVRFFAAGQTYERRVDFVKFH